MIGPVSLIPKGAVMPDLLRPDGQLLLLPTGYYNNMDFEGIRLFCHKNARYGLPTIELIDWLHEEIGTRSAIEIGAGHGDLSFHLGVPATDNYMQRRPEVAAHYRLTGQPTIDYPARVEHLDASAAIIKGSDGMIKELTAFCAQLGIELEVRQVNFPPKGAPPN